MLDSEVRRGLKPTTQADFVSGSEIELGEAPAGLRRGVANSVPPAVPARAGRERTRWSGARYGRSPAEHRTPSECPQAQWGQPRVHPESVEALFGSRSSRRPVGPRRRYECSSFSPASWRSRRRTSDVTAQMAARIIASASTNIRGTITMCFRSASIRWLTCSISAARWHTSVAHCPTHSYPAIEVAGIREARRERSYHHSEADGHGTGVRDAAVAEGASNVVQEVVESPAPECATTASPQALATILRIVGITVEQASGPFKDIACHVSAAVGTISLGRIPSHRRRLANVPVEVAEFRCGAIVPPGKEPAIASPRSLLPLSLAGNEEASPRSLSEPTTVAHDIIPGHKYYWMISLITWHPVIFPIDWCSVTCCFDEVGILSVGHWILGDFVGGKVESMVWNLKQKPPLPLQPSTLQSLPVGSHPELTFRDGHHLRQERIVPLAEAFTCSFFHRVTSLCHSVLIWPRHRPIVIEVLTGAGDLFRDPRRCAWDGLP